MWPAESFAASRILYAPSKKSWLADLVSSDDGEVGNVRSPSLGSEADRTFDPCEWQEIIADISQVIDDYYYPRIEALLSRERHIFVLDDLSIGVGLSDLSTGDVLCKFDSGTLKYFVRAVDSQFVLLGNVLDITTLFRHTAAKAMKDRLDH
jgi:hypothetical protein